MAAFKYNVTLIAWVNRQPLAKVFLGLGDGHDGIWNIFEQIGSAAQRYEILDWYHLVENLHQVRTSLQGLEQVKMLLWHGKVDQALQAFDGTKCADALKFVAYVQKHRHRLPNYRDLQQEGFAIGSGAVESAVKQIGRRVYTSHGHKLSFMSCSALLSISKIPRFAQHDIQSAVYPRAKYSYQALNGIKRMSRNY